MFIEPDDVYCLDGVTVFESERHPENVRPWSNLGVTKALLDHDFVALRQW